MSSVTQVAFQLDSSSVVELDKIAADRSSSRAEVLRTAVRELLARHREASIDAQLAAGYGVRPPDAESTALADVSIDGLQSTDLDW